MSLEHKMIRSGVVVSNKADKTVVVKVERKFQHPLYSRTVKQTAKFMAHDETNACQIGDVVQHRRVAPPVQAQALDGPRDHPEIRGVRSRYDSNGIHAHRRR
jgi:small subunit ribosomal protein S17